MECPLNHVIDAPLVQNPPRFAGSTPVILAVLGLAALAVPADAGPMVACFGGLISLPFVATATLTRSGIDGIPPSLRRIALMTSLPVIALGISAVLAQNPYVSILGLAGQHNGWLLWLTAWSWMVVWSRSTASTGSWAIRVLASLGAVSGLIAVLDRLGIWVQTARFSAEPTGLFESSISLGQFLTITTFCTAAWAITAMKRGSGRALPLLLMSLCLAGLIVSVSGGAYLAVVIGTWTGVSLARTGDATGRSRGWAMAPFVTVLLTSTVLLVVAATLPDSGIFAAADHALGGRMVIWRSAIVDAWSHPLFGAGPDQFSAWISWGPGPTGALSTQGAFDPHNGVLSTLYSGGLLAITAGAVAIAAVFMRLRHLRLGIPQHTERWLIAGITAWSVSCLTAWIDPLSCIAAATVVGILLSRADPKMEGHREQALCRGSSTRLLAIGIALTVCLAVLLARPFLAELHWASGRDQISAHEAGPIVPTDPTFALSEIRYLLAQTAAGTDTTGTDLERARQLAAEIAPDSTWHIDVALTRAEVIRAGSIATGEDRWEEFVSVISAGREADPLSGIWDYILAREAERNGRAAEARTYAAAALGYPLTADARSTLEELAGMR
jgi:hypothetical protein